MAGVVDIVNRALTKLGTDRIASLADPAKAARSASACYEFVRDAVISEHNWHFARDRAQLPALAEKPAFEWQWQYQLPVDCLRVIQAGPWPGLDNAGYISGNRAAWSIEGQKLMTNLAPPLNLVYIRRVPDPGMYPPVFIEALASRLAVEMCEELTGANSKRQLAWDEYGRAVQQAKHLNAIQLPPQPVADDGWLAAHYGGAM